MKTSRFIVGLILVAVAAGIFLFGGEYSTAGAIGLGVLGTVAIILVLSKLAGADFGSVFIRRGNLKWALAVGLAYDPGLYDQPVCARAGDGLFGFQDEQPVGRKFVSRCARYLVVHCNGRIHKWIVRGTWPGRTHCSRGDFYERS